MLSGFQESLRNTVFPVGGLTKTQVREIARQEGLDKVNQKKEVSFTRSYRNFNDKFQYTEHGHLLCW